MVGMAFDATANQKAFRWTQTGGVQDLNLIYGALLPDGSVLISANAISPNGRYIVGVGRNATTNRYEGFWLDAGEAPNSAPAQPEILSPADNVFIVAQPVFRLKSEDPDGDAVRFIIQLSRQGETRTFTTDFAPSGTEVTFTLPPDQALSNGEEWTWQARAEDTHGASSAWTNARGLRVGITISPEEVVLVPHQPITVRIASRGVSPEAQVYLQVGEQRINASSVRFISESEIEAQFSPQNVPIGAHDLVVSQGGQQFPKRFYIYPYLPALQVWSSGPTVFAPGRRWAIGFWVRNLGSAPAVAVIGVLIPPFDLVEVWNAQLLGQSEDGVAVLAVPIQPGAWANPQVIVVLPWSRIQVGGDLREPGKVRIGDKLWPVWTVLGQPIAEAWGIVESQPKLIEKVRVAHWASLMAGGYTNDDVVALAPDRLSEYLARARFGEQLSSAETAVDILAQAEGLATGLTFGIWKPDFGAEWMAENLQVDPALVSTMRSWGNVYSLAFGTPLTPIARFGAGMAKAGQVVIEAGESLLKAKPDVTVRGALRIVHGKTGVAPEPLRWGYDWVWGGHSYNLFHTGYHMQFGYHFGVGWTKQGVQVGDEFLHFTKWHLYPGGPAGQGARIAYFDRNGQMHEIPLKWLGNINWESAAVLGDSSLRLGRALAGQFRLSSLDQTADNPAEVRASYDPNDIAVFPDSPLVQASQRLVYVVSFENLPEANLPAENVTITLQLDEDLDLDSVIQEGSSHPNLPQVTTDPATRTITWRFVGINLPPNRQPPDGEGWVRFSVQPRADVASGAETLAKATIVFDENPPIETRQVRTVVDASAPTSQMNALAAVQSSPNFEVSWQATDDLSGVASVDLLVSERPAVPNSTPSDYRIHAVVPGNAEPRMQFRAKFGYVYRFATAGVDKVGNVASEPQEPQAITRFGQAPELPAGLHLVAIPVQSEVQDPQAVFGFENNEWARYDPEANNGAGGYVRYGEDTSGATSLAPSAQVPAKAFWVRLRQATQPRIYGPLPDDTQPFVIRLERGWNMVGNPFLRSVPWDTSRIKVKPVGGSEAIAINTEQARQHVEDYAWGWRADAQHPQRGEYVLIYDANMIPGVQGELEPWKGFWIYARQECDLILPPVNPR